MEAIVTDFVLKKPVSKCPFSKGDSPLNGCALKLKIATDSVY